MVDGLVKREVRYAAYSNDFNYLGLHTGGEDYLSEEKISKRKQQSTKGLNTYGDSEHVSGDYTAYRLGMAVAGANGKDPLPKEMYAKSWIGKQKSTHPYTQEEQDMLKQAYKVVGATHTDLNNGDMESRELDTVYKVSPIPKPKKNKYGV
jgi:hypothetical protein